MLTLAERLNLGAEILTLIDRKRDQTGDSNFAAGIERAVLDSHLRELDDAPVVEATPKEQLVLRRSHPAA
jgi:hypothetical protein